jgi:hypothetical protein
MSFDDWYVFWYEFHMKNNGNEIISDWKWSIGQLKKLEHNRKLKKITFIFNPLIENNRSAKTTFNLLWQSF